MQMEVVNEMKQKMQTLKAKVNPSTDEATTKDMILKFEEVRKRQEENESNLEKYPLNKQQISYEWRELETKLDSFKVEQKNKEGLQTTELFDMAEFVKTLIENEKSTLERRNDEFEVFVEKKYSLYMASRIVQVIAAGLLIAAGIMISNAKPCQLEEALKSIDLKNKPFFCKHNSIKNTNAVWGIGVFVLLSNFVLSLCPCLHFNCKCTYTRPKLNVWCTLFISTLSAIGLVCIFLVYFIWEEIKHTDISYLDLQSSMISSLKTSFTSDEIDSSNAISNAWNELFIQYECCAVNEVLGTTNDFDETPWCTTSGTCQATASQIPKSCCNDVTKSNYQSAPSACHASVNSGTYKSSCISRMKELSMENIEGYQLTVVFFLALFIATVEVVEVFLLTVPLNTCCKKSCSSNGVGQS